MKISIYILSSAIIISLVLFIFWEICTQVSGNPSRTFYLLHGFIILPGIFIVNIIRTILTNMLFKELTVFRPLPYVLNGITLYLLLFGPETEDITGIVVILSMLISILVECLIICEMKRGKQFGIVL